MHDAFPSLCIDFPVTEDKVDESGTFAAGILTMEL
jgi:hypothetical protein